MYGLHASACPGQWSQQKSVGEREADAHDHKGPARTKTLALLRYGDRGVCGYLCAVFLRVSTSGRVPQTHALTGRDQKWIPLAEGQRLQSALCLVRDRPVAGVAARVVWAKISAARREHSMAWSWHHPGPL